MKYPLWFIGRVVNPSVGANLIKLKLDHNIFGTEGLRMLATGLAMNNKLQKLSLNYCGIDENGSIYLQEILANLQTKLLKLKLQGNQLMNKGIYELFRALQYNKTLQKLVVSDNQMNLIKQDPMYVNKICDVLRKTKNIGYCDMAFNMISNEDAIKIIEEDLFKQSFKQVDTANALLSDKEEEAQKEKEKKEKE